jgi:hypothetical protein
MVLRYDIGEIVEGMDDIFRVVPVEKYKQQPRLTCIVKRQTGSKFKRMIDVELPIWSAAFEHAQEAFINSGAQPGAPLTYDVIAQEYPRTNIVCFIFAATINGQEMFVTAPFALTQQQISELTLRNLWQPYTVN